MTDDDDVERRIHAFWIWWEAQRPAIERAIRDGSLPAWSDAVSREVDRMDPGLEWEFGKGLRAQHYFCVAPRGDPELRVLTERWRSLGPADDETFELHPVRPGGGPNWVHERIVFGPIEFAIADFRLLATIDDVRARVDLEVWHPSFAASAETLRTKATFVALDNLLGEDDVERWIGSVEVLGRAPDGGIDFRELYEVVRRLRATASEERWTILRWELPTGDAAFVSTNLALKRVDHLLFDVHVEIDVELADPTADGLTQSDEADALYAAEDVLTESLGRDAVFVARETREGLRVLHFHVPVHGPAMDRIEAWRRAQPWSIEVRTLPDPYWSILRRW